MAITGSVVRTRGGLGLIAAAAAAATTLTLGAASTAAAGRVEISPQPGTQDASPGTQISIFGVPRREIESVRVAGSVSGAHPGTLRTYSGDRGASFVLARPLTQGERVNVEIRIKGHIPIAFAFTVAELLPNPPIINIPATQPAKLQHFVTAKALLPPKIAVHKTGPTVVEDLFLTPLPSPIVHPSAMNAISIKPVGPGGPMIIDRNGKLVWFHQLPRPIVASNFEIQRWNGKPVLTWWQGAVTIAAYGLGDGEIYDTSYRPLKVVHAGNGYSADVHEFVLTRSGDALMTVQSLVNYHLPGTAPGKLSLLIDSIVQEIDVRTGLVVWEWHSLGHIPLSASFASPATSPYDDVFHVNSIEQVPGNRLLISARDTCAIYEIDQATGRVLWTLGGMQSSFKMGPGTSFYFQHDARLEPGGRIGLFDDEGGPPFFAKSSRGLVLKLDTGRRTASLARQYPRPRTLADSEGSLQTLAGGDALVGFGSEPDFTEFTSSGRMLFDASLPSDDGSYRVYGFRWAATPRTRPAVTARRTSPGHVSVYVSWNGANTVRRWQLLAGSSDGTLRPVAMVADRAFETRIALARSASRFEVRALGASGRVLASSKPVGSS